MSIKILAIDDDDTIRRLWSDFLSENKDYIVESAASGEEGVAKLDEARDYDIVITDLKMAGISGMEVVKMAKKINPETEIMIVTGYGTVEAAVDAMKLGAYDFILKPANLKHIDFMIQKCYQQIVFRRENKELREINVKLKELNEEKEKFLTITSHELRTPVNIVTGLVSLLSVEISSLEKKKHAKHFDILTSACNKLKEIVDNMYDLSMAKENKLEFNNYDFCIDDLAEQLALDYSLFSLNRKLIFEIDNTLKGESFFGDMRRIKQAAEKLLQNAVKYTKDGGFVKVKIYKDFVDDKECLIIEVNDSGIGIAKEKIDKIFNCFYETQNSLKHHTSKTEFMGGGIGVGLAIAKEIAKAYDGKIDVESNPKIGSTFKLSLPYKAKKRDFRESEALPIFQD